MYILSLYNFVLKNGLYLFKFGHTIQDSVAGLSRLGIFLKLGHIQQPV